MANTKIKWEIARLQFLRDMEEDCARGISSYIKDNHLSRVPACLVEDYFTGVIDYDTLQSRIRVYNRRGQISFKEAKEAYETTMKYIDKYYDFWSACNLYTGTNPKVFLVVRK